MYNNEHKSENLISVVIEVVYVPRIGMMRD